jgi:hypothetical protein
MISLIFLVSSIGTGFLHMAGQIGPTCRSWTRTEFIKVVTRHPSAGLAKYWSTFGLRERFGGTGFLKALPFVLSTCPQEIWVQNGTLEKF